LTASLGAESSPLLSREEGRFMQVDLPIDFRQLRIVIVHPHDQDGDSLLRHLQRLRCQVELMWPVPEKLDELADVAFCLVNPLTYALCTELMRTRRVAVTAIVDPESPRVTNLLAGIGPQAVLTKPFDATSILTNVVVAYTSSRYQSRLLNKIAKLEETLRSIRTVERAKAMLMQARNIDEPEAYAYLRDQAMRKRVSVGSVASVVVASGNILLGSED
jgi:two-component system, response regulator PdtaR